MEAAGGAIGSCRPAPCGQSAPSGSDRSRLLRLQSLHNCIHCTVSGISLYDERTEKKGPAVADSLSTDSGSTDSGSTDSGASADGACDSLRERKKRRTQDAIHLAALELVAEQGLSAVTVEKIAERAGVSPRTFFNHWATKESAVLGLNALGGGDVAQDLRDRPESEGPAAALRETIRMFIRRISSAPERRELKRAVMLKEPQLHVLSAGQSQATQQDLIAAYEERLRRAAPQLSPDAVRARATLAVQVAYAIVRSAFAVSMAQGTELTPEFERTLEAYEAGGLI